jgi:hypothetical protein
MPGIKYFTFGSHLYPAKPTKNSGAMPGKFPAEFLFY